jgi:hypothetical protein
MLASGKLSQSPTTPLFNPDGKLATQQKLGRMTERWIIRGR